MATLDKFLFVGDSFTVLMQNSWDKTYGTDVKFHAKVGRTSKQLKQLIEKGTDFPKESEINGVVLLIGVNSALDSNCATDTVECIKLLKNKYKSKKLYVQRVFPVCAKYTTSYGYSWTKLNEGVKAINVATSNYCKTADGVYYIDATKGFSNNAVLIDSKTADGLHIKPAYVKDHIKNIADCVSNGSQDNQEDTSGYPPVLKKLLPNMIAGKSYDISGFEPKFIIIHNMGGGDNESSYNF